MLKFSMISLMSVLLSVSADIKWEMTKDDGIITTYIGDNSGTGLRPTRSTMLVNQPIEKAFGTIMNINRYPAWVPYCGEARILEQSDSTMLFYQVLDMPMVKNRDIVIKAVIKEIDNGLQISMTSAPEMAKEDPDAIRITDFSAVYTLTNQESDTSTRIELTNRVNPGGYIPTFATNWASRTQPYQTFNNLKRELTR